ncbi:MAG: type VI secretion system baseplate subunit TssF [Desulfatitalea sp.]|nr:type VI secretion system baseplate subunit TssF [Desulfatitalea sp.]NNK01209.1 type VI secretion system baseplate subunit TssF [Desulfatitalea sp.]
MDDPLLHYYERELTFIRESGARFAEKYPKIAGRLLMEPDRCEDPHTERLLEAFAFLTGRIQKKIDDAYPELTESLLQIIYPHYTRPLPAMTTVKFIPQLANVPSSGHDIPKGARIQSPPVKRTKLIFTTVQDVRLLPVEIRGAELVQPYNPALDVRQGVKVEIHALPEMTLDKIEWPDTLRFFLHGHQQQIFKLYELIMNHVVQIRISSYTEEKGIKRSEDTYTLTAAHIAPVGFADHENLLPWPQQSFDGYRLLYEYFAFAEKFLYFDLSGLSPIRQMAGDGIEIEFLLDRECADQIHVDNDTFRLYTTPAVNLFSQMAQPVRVEHTKTQYPIYHSDNAQSRTEVFSIDAVVGITGEGENEIVYQPFYAVSHFGQKETGSAYWHIQRRPSPRKGDAGTDVMLAFTDEALAMAQPQCTTLTVHTTCTNRDLPERLTPGGIARDFYLEHSGPIDGIDCLMKPTAALRPKPGGHKQWRLISHLSLNYLSMLEDNGRGLKEMLKLYDIHDSPITRQQIEGIESVAYRHETMRLGRALCRGVEITIVFNEEKFVGSSIYLFSAVLDQFVAQYVSINSFTRLMVKSLQRTEPIKAWPPRSGKRILI